MCRFINEEAKIIKEGFQNVEFNIEVHSTGESNGENSSSGGVSKKLINRGDLSEGNRSCKSAEEAA